MHQQRQKLKGRDWPSEDSFGVQAPIMSTSLIKHADHGKLTKKTNMDQKIAYRVRKTL